MRAGVRYVMASVKQADKAVKKTAKGAKPNRRAGSVRGLPLTDAIELSLKVRRRALDELAKR